MTTTAPTPAGLLAEPWPTDTTTARRLVTELVAAGLPTPLWLPTIREDDDDLALSLTLASAEDLDAWAEHVVTVDALADVERGQPWTLGGRHYRVVVGRLAGLRTVLAAETATAAVTS